VENTDQYQYFAKLPLIDINISRKAISILQVHFHFIVHRLVKGRNRYTSRQYLENKRPKLPSAKVPKTASTDF